MGTRARRGTYLVIAAALRSRIEGREFAGGKQLPSESAVCEQYGVGRDTARRAYAELEQDGLVRVEPGRGRVVGADSTSDVPRNELAERLVAELASGHYRVEELFLSEGKVAKDYSVTRHYARQALDSLEQQGFIRAEQGRGRVIVSIPPAV